MESSEQMGILLGTRTDNCDYVGYGLLRRSSKEVPRKFHLPGSIHICWGVATWHSGQYFQVCGNVWVIFMTAVLVHLDFMGWIRCFRADAVLLAVGITAVICLALTAFSFQTKWDFTAMGSGLFVCLVVLVIFGFLAMFLRNTFPILNLIYACLGALLFSVYLVYDTQLMIGGKHKYSISPEEYIFAALNIYMDIINIFIYILTIIGSSSD